MIQDDYLRLQKNIPTTPPPPKGFVDLRYSQESASLVTVSEDGTAAPIGSSSAAKEVANAAARLALSLEAAQGFAVVDADTGKTWMLVAGGIPSTSGDWLQLGDRNITTSDITDPENLPISTATQTALDGKMANTAESVAAVLPAAIATDPAAVRANLRLLAVNVADYGATGDGVTDDTANIAAAITAAQSATGSGMVYFPPGVFLCNLTITNNVILVGAGGGSVGDWEGSNPLSSIRTTLSPYDDASPVIKVTLLRGVRVEHMEIRGNGAGTSANGILLQNSTPGNFVGNGFTLYDCIVRRFSDGFMSNGGCNVMVRECGIFENNRCINISDSGFAHSYVIELCSLGGLATSNGTGDSRCIQITAGSPHLTVIHCEQGNCTDYMVVGGSMPIVNILNGNWETISTGPLVALNAGSLIWNGGRLSTPGLSLVRAAGATIQNLGIHGVQTPGAVCLIESDNFKQFDISGQPKENLVRIYNTDFSALVAESPWRPGFAYLRLTSNQNLPSSGVHVFQPDYTQSISGLSYDSGTGLLTVLKGGVYDIDAYVQMAYTTGNPTVKVRVNGYVAAVLSAMNSGAVAVTIVGGSRKISLAAGNTVDITVTVGGGVDIQASTGFASAITMTQITAFQ